jgi:hypothetical protein
VKAEREEHVEASQSLVPSIEVALGHGEGMPKVQRTIHIRIGEGLEELGLLCRFSDEILMALPNVASPLLERDQLVSASGVLHRINYGAK